ncbi:dTDP-4-dehydrorhamnose 3,5-epimerase, partial [Mycobacteroides franklinii]
MQIRELSVPGSFEITPVQHQDSRGVFLELFKGPALAEAIGHPFDLQQANCSVSAA